MQSEVDQLLHDADRAVMGAQFAQRLGDGANASLMTKDAEDGYRRALELDPTMADPAWREDGNRDTAWLTRHGFEQIAKTASEKERR